MRGFRAWIVLGAFASLVGCGTPPSGDTLGGAPAVPGFGDPAYATPADPGFVAPTYTSPGRSPSRASDPESVRRYMDSMNERLNRARAGGGQPPRHAEEASPARHSPRAAQHSRHAPAPSSTARRATPTPHAATPARSHSQVTSHPPAPPPRATPRRHPG